MVNPEVVLEELRHIRLVFRKDLQAVSNGSTQVELFCQAIIRWIEKLWNIMGLMLPTFQMSSLVG